jgi:Fe-S cluster assembly iron-binding protein IscA
MALDEPKESDQTFDIDGFTYIVDKEFMKAASPVKIDFIDYGFKLTSNIQLGGGCGGCGGSTSCSV